MSVLATLNFTEGSNGSNQTKKKKNERHPDWKGRGKTISFWRLYILHTENSKEYTTKLSELIVQQVCRVQNIKKINCIQIHQQCKTKK